MLSRFSSTALVGAAMFALGALLSPGLGAASAQPLDPAACATATPAPGDPTTVKGTGKTQTLPFDLAGGAYTVDWQIGQSSDAASYSLRLMPVVDAPFNHGQTIMSAIYTKNPDATGQTHLYDVKPGKYYLAVDVPKGWSVTLTPLAV